MLKWLLYLWAAPITILMFIVLLFLWMIRQAEPVSWYKRWGFWHWEWEAIGGLHSLLEGTGYLAFAIGGGLVLTAMDGKDAETRAEVMAHEAAHSRQILILGIFHPLLYLLSMLTIWIATPWLESYRDNPFELDAQRAGRDNGHDEVPR